MEVLWKVVAIVENLLELLFGPRSILGVVAALSILVVPTLLLFYITWAG